MTTIQIAKRISDRILLTGNGVMCNRIALKSGTWPDNEKDEGGLCAVALETLIADELALIVKLDTGRKLEEKPCIVFRCDALLKQKKQSKPQVAEKRPYLGYNPEGFMAAKKGKK